MIVERITGDLLEVQHPFIAQQCNCLTTKAHGLSKSVAEKFPWANPYAFRSCVGNRNTTLRPSSPGTIEIYDSPDGQKHVVCMMAQWAPGKPLELASRYPELPNGMRDTGEQRRLWFRRCLRTIDAHLYDDENVVVAVPHMIGCGLAGGDWTAYEAMLEEARTKFAIVSLP